MSRILQYEINGSMQKLRTVPVDVPLHAPYPERNNHMTYSERYTLITYSECDNLVVQDKCEQAGAACGSTTLAGQPQDSARVQRRQN